MSLHLKRTNELKSCIGLIEDETSYSDEEFHQNYCNQKLRLFKNNHFALSVRIIGNEKVNDVADNQLEIQSHLLQVTDQCLGPGLHHRQEI